MKKNVYIVIPLSLCLGIFVGMGCNFAFAQIAEKIQPIKDQKELQIQQMDKATKIVEELQKPIDIQTPDFIVLKAKFQHNKDILNAIIKQ